MYSLRVIQLQKTDGTASIYFVQAPVSMRETGADKILLATEAPGITRKNGVSRRAVYGLVKAQGKHVKPIFTAVAFRLHAPRNADFLPASNRAGSC
jgi:hypothetical protein